MPALSDLIERVRTAARDFQSRTTISDNPLTTAATTVNFVDGAQIAPGSRISVELETLYVITKPTVNQATAARGDEATTAAQHASGAKAYISPRHTAAEYQQAINNALDAISIGFGEILWDETQTFDSDTGTLKVPGAAIRVLGVYEKPTLETDLVPVAVGRMFRAPLSLITSGKAVRLESEYNPGSGTVYIEYEVAWPRLTTLAGTLDANYPAEAEDLITLGAIAYLMDPETFARVAFDAPQARIQTSASPFSDILGEHRNALGRFLMRRNELSARLRPQNLGWIKR